MKDSSLKYSILCDYIHMAFWKSKNYTSNRHIVIAKTWEKRED